MLDEKQLKNMCRQPVADKAYYQPLVCIGDMSKIGIFVVGTNPALSVYSHEIDIDTYTDLLFNYERFMDYYRAIRFKEGLPEMSRIRTGLHGFLTWLSEQTNFSVAETNVIAYPTPTLVDLKKVPSPIIGVGKSIFRRLLAVIKPQLIILHGKPTVVSFRKAIEKEKLAKTQEINLYKPIEYLEMCSPLTHIQYPNGRYGTVLACRNLSLYGRNGNGFSSFKKLVKANLISLSLYQNSG
ncbi:MAG: hypothetical protein H6Q67_1564 [Firmicutes bacterium]|nr:hypothetical protein [Bacillota bacterium]